MEKTKPKVHIPPFNDHKNCSGHANFFLDCTYEKEEDQLLLIKSLGNYVTTDSEGN